MDAWKKIGEYRDDKGGRSLLEETCGNRRRFQGSISFVACLTASAQRVTGSCKQWCTVSFIMDENVINPELAMDKFDDAAKGAVKLYCQQNNLIPPVEIVGIELQDMPRFAAD